jgi:MscS family membrane protein
MDTKLGKWAMLLVAAIAWGVPASVEAQLRGSSGTTAQPVPSTTQAPTIARDSPRAAFRAFTQASVARRWDDAARYLELDSNNLNRGPELARHLNAVIGSLYQLDPHSISGSPEGRLDDDLPTDVEEIGQVEVDGNYEPVRLVRTSETRGVFWQFDRSTVARIDTWYTSMRSHWLREKLRAAGLRGLLRQGPFGLLYWQWLALPLIAFLSWMLGMSVHGIGKPLMARLTARTRNIWDDQIVAAFGPPFVLAFTVTVFMVAWVLIELPRPALIWLQPFLRVGTSFAVFWALWRSSRVLVAWAMSRPWAVNSASYRNLVSFSSNIWQGIIVGAGALVILSAIGFPISTVLAGLGIGGLAVAFGAQKTIENVFGSVSLAIDQPFRIGDFVKVQDFVGTVENIGLRSTRFRTNERTLVSIPNGKLADERLESYEARDRMLFSTTIGLTYGTTRDQMKTVLEGIECVLRTHPRIWPGNVVVRFKSFGQNSLDIEIMAWFEVPTWSEFQGCREEVLLAFMELIEKAGTSFAFPTRTVHLVKEAKD